jgi:hypothetical protein
MLEALLSHPLTLRLGWTLVHSLWLGLALAGLLGLALLLFAGKARRPRRTPRPPTARATARM